jgi:hypothetical protein
VSDYIPASSLEAFPPVPASKVNRDIHIPRLVKRRWVWPTVAAVTGFLSVSTFVVAVFTWGV